MQKDKEGDDADPQDHRRCICCFGRRGPRAADQVQARVQPVLEEAGCSARAGSGGRDLEADQGGKRRGAERLPEPDRPEAGFHEAGRPPELPLHVQAGSRRQHKRLRAARRADVRSHGSDPQRRQRSSACRRHGPRDRACCPAARNQPGEQIHGSATVAGRGGRCGRRWRVVPAVGRNRRDGRAPEVFANG